MRGVFMAMVVASLSVPAHGAPDLKTQKNSYMFGIKCYVANGVAASDRRYIPDRSGGEFRAKAQKSYEVIWAMGRAIGNSDALIQEDIDSYQNLLRDRYLHDDAYFQRTQYECGRVGLM